MAFLYVYYRFFYLSSLKQGIIDLFIHKFHKLHICLSKITYDEKKAKIFMLVELNRLYNDRNVMAGIASCYVFIICLNFLLDITTNILLIFSLTIVYSLLLLLKKGHFKDVEEFNKANNLDKIPNNKRLYTISFLCIVFFAIFIFILSQKTELFPDIVINKYTEFIITEFLIQSDILFQVSFILFIFLHYTYFSTPRTLYYFLLNHHLTFDDEEYNKPEIEQFKCYSKLKKQHKTSEINLIYSFN